MSYFSCFPSRVVLGTDPRVALSGPTAWTVWIEQTVCRPSLAWRKETHIQLLLLGRTGCKSGVTFPRKGEWASPRWISSVSCFLFPLPERRPSACLKMTKYGCCKVKLRKIIILLFSEFYLVKMHLLREISLRIYKALVVEQTHLILKYVVLGCCFNTSFLWHKKIFLDSWCIECQT